jgi:hypothetical protein
MYYGDKRDAKVKISYALAEKGWKIYGFSEDQSDSMTDYYHPASWDGIAEKNGFVLIIDISGSYGLQYSGKEVRKYNYNGQAAISSERITKLRALMNDAASTENEKASCAVLIEKEEQKANVEPSYTVTDAYPVFSNVNPKACTWHIEKDGQILAKGKGVFSTNDYDWEDETKSKEEQKAEKLTAFINRVESVLRDSEALRAEVIRVEKKVIKPVEKTDKTINENDILGFSYHGHYWIVTSVYQNNSQTRIVYELLGSEKRGYNRLNGASVKRYYQTLERLQKEMEEGKTKVYTLQEVTEYEEKIVYKKTARKAAMKKDVAELTGEVEEAQTESQETAHNSSVTASYTLNSELNGVEVSFPNKPEQATIDTLKQLGFRWHKFKKVWYAVQTPERLTFVKSICTDNNDNSTQEEEQPENVMEEATEETITAEETADNIIEKSASLMTDWTTTTVKKPETEEEKTAYKNAIEQYITEHGYTITDEHITAVKSLIGSHLLVDVLESLYGTQEPITEQENDSYTFTVDLSFKYHDIHFKAWNMELETIQEYLTVFEIPFYIAGDKFICKGLTVEQVLMVEEINFANGAIIFYDNKYNEKPNNSEQQTEQDNVIYYDFANNQKEEESDNNSMINNEPEVNVNDDFLSMFDQVEIENNSRIAADDMTFCQLEQMKYETAIQMIIRLANEIKNTSGLDILSKEWHKQKSTNEYLEAYKFKDIKTLADDIKEKFTRNIVNHFEKKYNVTIETSKLDKSSEYGITYENILDHIFLQLDGFSFEEKATKEIKDKLKENFTNRWSKVSIKNKKLTITDYVWWDGYSWSGKRIGWNDSKVNPLFHALSLFEINSTDMLITFENVIRELKEGEQKYDIFSKYEFDHLDKAKSFKVFKNGKIEIEFATTEQAFQFVREYCGVSNVA